MTDRLFDVICFGTDRQGEERETARKALAVILKIDLEEAETLLSRGMITLRQGIVEADAKALLATLGKIGLRCNYKPAAASFQALEIVPVEEEGDRPRKIECPECGTQSYFRRNGESAPAMCPSCGLVFAKHDRIMQEKAEREAIRRKLLQAQQSREAELRAEAERQAEAERREKLEEAIRSELRLPKMFGTRGRLIGSATTLFLLGIASGSLGARLWWTAPAPASSTGAEATGGPGAANGLSKADPEQWLLKSGAGGNVDPGTQLLLSLDAATKASAAPPHPPGIEGNELRSPLRPATAFGENPPRTAGAGAPFDRLPSSLRTIEPGPEAAEALGLLAKESAGHGDNAAAAALLAELRSRVEAVSDPAWRTKALAQAADLHRDAGDATQAETLFKQGLQQADRLSPGADRAAALGALAASASRMGRSDQRDTLLRQANRDIVKIEDPSRKLSAVCEMAEQYGLAGQRGGALGLLDQVVRSARNLPTPALRNAVLARAALAQARVGDPNGALAAIAEIDGQDSQDAAIFAIIEESAKWRNAIWIEEFAGRLASPRYVAAALALLGESRAARSGWSTEVERAFTEAENAAKLISRPDEKQSALGQVAQAYARAGRPGQAEALFGALTKEAQALTGEADRSQALGTIADRQAAVLLTDQALTTSSLIPDPVRKAEIQRHVEDVRRVAAILRPKTNGSRLGNGN